MTNTTETNQGSDSKIGALSAPMNVWRFHKQTLEAAVHRSPAVDAIKAELLKQLNAVTINDWQGLHLTEHQLIDHMTDPEVKDHLLYVAGVAGRVGIVVAPPLLAGLESLTLVPLKSRTHAVLADIYEQHTQRDLKHMSRRYAGSRIAKYGCAFGLVLVVIIGFLALGGAWIASIPSNLFLSLVFFFGALGAYVSQLINFYGAIPSIDYRTIENRYSHWSLGLRYLMGAFAAFLISTLIAGQLLGGDMFPKIDNLRNALWITGNNQSWPTVDFAKLLAWSFIAGFSERLLSDQLTRIEGGTNKT